MRACWRAVALLVLPSSTCGLQLSLPAGGLSRHPTRIGFPQRSHLGSIACVEEEPGDAAKPSPAEPSPAAELPAAPEGPGQYKFKVDKSGAGFNQFDPVLSLSQAVSRRFGLAGGLALVAILAATEGNEILKGVTDTGPVAGDGVRVTLPSGLQYEELLIASRGDTPEPGSVIGFDAKVTIGDQVLFDTKSAKPVAFKYGQRPFQNVVCDGVEEGIKGMRVGGRRMLYVPQELAPPGVKLPSGVPLVYDLTLTEVLRGYF